MLEFSCHQWRNDFGTYMYNLGAVIAPFGNCLPVTELLQSPFRTEFSMGSLSRRYRQSMRRHRRFLWSYRWSLGRYRRSLRRSAAARSPMPIVAWLTKHRKMLLNIVRHHETLWYIMKRHELLVKHHETLLKHCETSQNTQTLTIQCDDIGARRGDIVALRGVIGAHAEFLAISSIAELV